MTGSGRRDAGRVEGGAPRYGRGWIVREEGSAGGDGGPLTPREVALGVLQGLLGALLLYGSPLLMSLSDRIFS